MVEPLSRAPYIAIVVVVLIAAGAGSAFLYETQKGSAPTTVRTVTAGQNVTVNYIGIFGSGPEAGRVFDTSLYKVAIDNITYPKTLEFSFRGASKYTPLAVHVGPTAPSGGYVVGNYTFIPVVTGFWRGLIGLPGNQTAALYVPPAEGYGALNTACLATRPLTTTLPIFATYTRTEFSTLYSGISSALGTVFSDPTYHWSVLVYASNASFVTIENLPAVGYSSSPGGWPVVVTSVAATANGTGLITLVSQLTPAQAGHLLGKDYGSLKPPCPGGSTQFIVWAVDPLNGTYTANYNQEVNGQTLIFVVTVVDIFGATKAEASAVQPPRLTRPRLRSSSRCASAVSRTARSPVTAFRTPRL